MRNADFFILGSIIFWIIIFGFLNLYLSKISKKYQKNIYIYLREILLPDEEILFLVRRNNSGFFSILSIFNLAIWLTFLFPLVLNVLLTKNFPIIPSNIKFFLVFITLLFVYFLFDFFDKFYKLLIVTNKRLICKSLFKIGKLTIITFDKIKEIKASTYRGIESLFILKHKEWSFFKINDISNAFKIRDNIQKLIFSPEKLEEQKKLEEIRKEKDLKYLAIFVILMPILLPLLFYYQANYPSINEYFSYLFTKKNNYHYYQIDLQGKK